MIMRIQMIAAINHFYFTFTKIIRMRILVAAVCLLAAIHSPAQSKNEKAICKVLDTQTDSWNKGDIQRFMIGYWQHDSLMFIGKSGITYGYSNTLNNYKKGYPDTTAMGKLAFTIITVKRLSGKYYHVVGKWQLKRSIGDLSGHYTLLFKKINGSWVVISDHSS